MKNRIFMGVFLLGILITAFGATVYFPLFLPLLFFFLNIVFVYELSNCSLFFKNKNFSLKEQLFLKIILHLSIGLFNLVLISNTFNLVPIPSWIMSNLFYFLALLYLIFSFFGIIYFKKITSLEIYALYFFLINYLALTLYSVYGILKKGSEGLIIILFLVLVASVTDTFAYFGGSLFGSKKMSSFISPQKTWEGFFSGLLFSIIFTLLYFNLIPHFNLQLSTTFNHQILSLSNLQILVIGIISGILAQLGDLLASAIKRFLLIKDFSSILKSHGGLIDRFDSMMLNSIFLYTLINYLYNN